MPFEYLKHNNTSKEDLEAIKALTNDSTIVIKKVDKGSCGI